MTDKGKKTSEISRLWKSWVTLLVWTLIILLFVQTAGIVIHETGHYLVGKAYGCENLDIDIAKFSFKDSLSNVTGWTSCKFPLVMNKDGSRVCNIPTNIDSLAGLALSLIVLIPILIFTNNKIKTRVRMYYLRRSHLVLMVIFTIVMTIKSASFDLFKVGECLFDTQVGETIFGAINLLPTLIVVPIIIIFLLDLIKVLDVISEDKTKKEAPQP